MYLPVAHGEGRFFVRDDRVLANLQQRNQLPLRYVSCAASRQMAEQQASGTPRSAVEAVQSDFDQPVVYPDNPNGSLANVAGMCDEVGRFFGLMPHPERHIDPTQHPRWTRGEAGEVGDGLRLFQNAVQFFR